MDWMSGMEIVSFMISLLASLELLPTCVQHKYKGSEYFNVLDHVGQEFEYHQDD